VSRRNSLPKYRRHKPSGQAVVTLTDPGGKFDVYRRRSVAFISGESGEHTLQETFLRIAKARGVARCRSRSQSGSMAPGGDPSPARRACRL
jgi:hypothetical protein